MDSGFTYFNNIKEGIYKWTHFNNKIGIRIVLYKNKYVQTLGAVLEGMIIESIGC